MSRSRLLLAALLLLAGCSGSDHTRLQFRSLGREVPGFSADSALHYLEAQIALGPRSPGSSGHRQGRAYLLDRLKSHAGPGSVYAQDFERVVEGDTLHLSNLIAAFNPASTDRILLCAHWDTRPRADRDSVDIARPIPGADDGASGVAVLLELARLFRLQPPPVGVDIVLFDGEDYGREGSLEHYFLGSRHWSEHPPVPDYRPRFGILLDMVGGTGAHFPKEGYSRRYAPALVDELWSVAAEMGYEELFADVEGAPVSDDHLVVNRLTGIPTIDIIHYRNGRSGGVDFAPWWHTHRDNREIIDPGTLEAVGSVLAELIYNRVR